LFVFLVFIPITVPQQWFSDANSKVNLQIKHHLQGHDEPVLRPADFYLCGSIKVIYGFINPQTIFWGDV
jgi:hypothetical protein